MEIWIPIGISIIALFVSVLGWHKNRVIYDIETEDSRNEHQKVKDLLNTGKYTIVHVNQDPSNPFRNVYVLGRIKKLK